MTDTPNDEGAAATANADMEAYWDGERGLAWVERADQFDRQLELYGLRAIAAVAPQPGETVVDIGCGAGATTFEVSQAVGATGRVVGVDISGPMLELAAQRAAAEGYSHVEFLRGDAQTMDPPVEGADAVVSRFGVMFFDDPVAAFTNIAAMVRPGGRLAFVCWGEFEANEWMWAPSVAVHDLAPLPAGQDPDAPGPFAFRDPERVASILAASGWTDVTFEDVTDAIYVGGPGPVEDAVEFILSSSTIVGALTDASDETMALVRERLVELFTPQHDLVGVKYPALARVVRATKPD